MARVRSWVDLLIRNLSQNPGKPCLCINVVYLRGFAQRFETRPGRQAQVDFAELKVEFKDEPGVTRKGWL